MKEFKIQLMNFSNLKNPTTNFLSTKDFSEYCSIDIPDFCIADHQKCLPKDRTVYVMRSSNKLWVGPEINVCLYNIVLVETKTFCE